MQYPKVITLAPPDNSYGNASHKVIVDYTCLANRGGAAGAVLTLQLFPAQTPSQFSAEAAPTTTCPAGTTARFAAMKLVTAFVGGATSSVTVTVGDDGDVDRLLTSTELHSTGTEILAKAEGAVTQPYSYPAANGIDAVFTVVGGNWDALTAGEVEIYLHISQPPTMAR